MQKSVQGVSSEAPTRFALVAQGDLLADMISFPHANELADIGKAG